MLGCEINEYIISIQFIVDLVSKSALSPLVDRINCSVLSDQISKSCEKSLLRFLIRTYFESK